MVVKADHFCWGVRTLQTILNLSLQNNRSGHQLVSPKNSCFAQNFYFIVIITTFLLKYYKFVLTIGQIRQCGQSLMVVAKIIILAFSFWLHDLPIHYWYYFL